MPSRAHPSGRLSPPRLFVSALAALHLHPPAALAQTIVVTVGPTIPTAAPEFVDKPTFASAVLNSTNTYRRQHNASDVSWNETLSDFAAGYLDGADCEFEHSGGPYGENLALGCANATSCVEAWGNERTQYDFGRPDFGESTGHFTQLVWKNTTDVGCGARLCGEKGWYLACEYWPRGNVIGAFAEEVGKNANGAVGLVARSGVVLVVASLLAGLLIT